jgi:hypothetical protein
MKADPRRALPWRRRHQQPGKAGCPPARSEAAVFPLLATGMESVHATTLAAPSTGKLPLRRDAEADTDGGLWMPLVVVFLFALAAAAYVMKRRAGNTGALTLAGRRGAATVTRLSSHALTPQASVHAVQWNGEEYLLGCTAQQVTLLGRRPVAGAQGELD